MVQRFQILKLNSITKRLNVCTGNYPRNKKGLRTDKKQKSNWLVCTKKINNIKSDFLHKLSKKIINENQIDHIFIEDKNVSGMIKNHKLARSIQAASWYKFYTLLAYKAEEAGKHLNKTGRFFPSSKMCSVRRYKNDALTLKDREWICPGFGINTVGTTGIKACGENVIPAHSEVILCEARSSHFKNR